MLAGWISMPRRPLMATSERNLMGTVRNVVWLGVALMCEPMAMAGKKALVPHCM